MNWAAQVRAWREGAGAQQNISSSFGQAQPPLSGSSLQGRLSSNVQHGQQTVNFGCGPGLLPAQNIPFNAAQQPVMTPQPHLAAGVPGTPAHFLPPMTQTASFQTPAVVAASQQQYMMPPTGIPTGPSMAMHAAAMHFPVQGGYPASMPMAIPGQGAMMMAGMNPPLPSDPYQQPPPPPDNSRVPSWLRDYIKEKKNKADDDTPKESALKVFDSDRPFDARRANTKRSRWKGELEAKKIEPSVADQAEKPVEEEASIDRQEQIAQLKFALTSILMETTHEMIENIAKGALEDARLASDPSKLLAVLGDYNSEGEDKSGEDDTTDRKLPAEPRHSPAEEPSVISVEQGAADEDKTTSHWTRQQERPHADHEQKENKRQRSPIKTPSRSPENRRLPWKRMKAMRSRSRSREKRSKSRERNHSSSRSRDTRRARSPRRQSKYRKASTPSRSPKRQRSSRQRRRSSSSSSTSTSSRSRSGSPVCSTQRSSPRKHRYRRHRSRSRSRSSSRSGSERRGRRRRRHRSPVRGSHSGSSSSSGSRGRRRSRSRSRRRTKSKRRSTSGSRSRSRRGKVA